MNHVKTQTRTIFALAAIVMKRYLDAMNRNSKDGLFTGSVGGGDWLTTGGGVADDVMGTAYLAFDFKLMAEMAEAIGETRDAATFRDKVAEVAEAFAKAHIDAEGNIKESSQSGFALAFTMGLVPPGLKEKPTFDSHKHATTGYSNNINNLGLSQNFGVCLQV